MVCSYDGSKQRYLQRRTEKVSEKGLAVSRSRHWQGEEDCNEKYSSAHDTQRPAGVSCALLLFQALATFGQTKERVTEVKIEVWKELADKSRPVNTYARGAVTQIISDRHGMDVGVCNPNASGPHK